MFEWFKELVARDKDSAPSMPEGTLVILCEAGIEMLKADPNLSARIETIEITWEYMDDGSVVPNVSIQFKETIHEAATGSSTPVSP